MIPEYGIVRLSAPTSLSIVGCRIACGVLDGIISSISHTFHVGRKDPFFSNRGVRKKGSEQARSNAGKSNSISGTMIAGCSNNIGNSY